jgi:three-Cys-motif partner protein
MKSLDIFLNFPVQDMNRNAFWKDPQAVGGAQIRRMNLFWGDESWRNIVYDTRRNLFGIPEKEPNEIIAAAFRRRLEEVAGFGCVPEPLAMENSKGAIVYYLFFASQKDTAEKIARESLPSTGGMEASNVRRDIDRMDRRNMESGAGLHED